MTNRTPAPPKDAYLESLKSARSSTTVLKLRLANFRSLNKKISVFAFEGDQDKVIYYHWIKGINPNINYEPFPCSGKKQVLLFRDMLDRDLGGLKEGVYYFIDRDFDDWAGFVANDNTFITEYYAPENYLVCAKVIDEFLTNEFHCHARPEIRKPIIELFSKLYDDFLSLTRDLNLRMFVSKMFNIDLIKHPPDNVSNILKISLDQVESGVKNYDDVISFSREPTKDEWDKALKYFSKLSPQARYRGKLALSFMQKWMLLLAEDHAKNDSILFLGLEKTGKVKQSEFVLGNFAAKSVIPPSLNAFLKKNKLISS